MFFPLRSASMKRRTVDVPPPPPHDFGGLSIRAAGGGAAGTRMVLPALVFAAGEVLYISSPHGRRR